MRRLFILDKTLKVCYTLLKFKKERHPIEKPNEGFYSVLRKETGKLETAQDKDTDTSLRETGIT